MQSLAVTIALALAGVLIYLNPVAIISTVMHDGFVDGLIKLRATNDAIKKKVSAEFVVQLGNNLDKNATAIGNAVAEKLGALLGDVDKGLAREIQDVRQQVESVLREKEKGEQDVAQHAEQLVAVEQELDKIDAGVDDLIVATAIG